MMDDELRHLVRRDAVPLDRLQADIWARESELLAVRRSGRMIAGWQAAILALAVLSSAGAGIFAGARLHDAQSLLTRSDLAPASLILGGGE